MSLGSRVVLCYCLSLIISVALLLILPAGTWRFWQAWIFLAIVFAYLLCAFRYFYNHDPQLLERRMRGKEKLAAQKRLILVWRPVFVVLFLIPGFDYRFGWSRRLFGEVPPWLSVLADVVILLGFLMVFWVLRVNSFASRTIELQTGQKVISSGPYALVRHPMYLGSIVLCVSIPLALGFVCGVACLRSCSAFLRRAAAR